MKYYQRIKRYIFGYDVFISYSRIDGLDYALELANKLISLKYDCYLDQLSSTTPGPILPNNIKNAVSDSSAFVLIGSNGAHNSSYIHQEIKLFLENNKNSPFIPISFDNSINNEAKWFDEINGLAFSLENINNLEKGEPSSDVITRIEKSLNFKTKSQKLRRISYFVLLTTLALGIVSLYFFYNLQSSIAKLGISKNQTYIEELKRNFNESDFTTVYDRSSEILSNLKNASTSLFCDTTSFTREILAFKTLKEIAYNFYRYDLLINPIEGDINVMIIDDDILKVVDETNTETYYKFSKELNLWEEFSGLIPKQKLKSDFRQLEPVQIGKEIFIRSLKDSTLFYVGYSENKIEKFEFNSNFISGLYAYDSTGSWGSKIYIWKMPVIIDLNNRQQNILINN